MGDGVARVIGVAALCSLPGTSKDDLPRRTIIEVYQVGLLRRVLEWDEIPFCLPARCGLRCGRDSCFRQPGKRRLVIRRVRSLLRGREEFIFECGRKGRRLFIQLLQLGLFGFGELGALVYELLVVALDQAKRLRIKFQQCTLLIDGSYALEEFSV